MKPLRATTPAMRWRTSREGVYARSSPTPCGLEAKQVGHARLQLSTISMRATQVERRSKGSVACGFAGAQQPDAGSQQEPVPRDA